VTTTTAEVPHNECCCGKAPTPLPSGDTHSPPKHNLFDQATATARLSNLLQALETPHMRPGQRSHHGGCSKEEAEWAINNSAESHLVTPGGIHWSRSVALTIT